ncbi:30S ribosomal protein S20 [Bartonella sp. DGB1]|uniref:30S ribosomal protein S20 n=1 Tax=Bartonella sp. DGB1 TaxID=3239807 RepID=UPI00352522CA
MANTSSAKKAARKIAARTLVNKARRSRVRTFIRKFDDAVASNNREQAVNAFKMVEPELMRASSKGVIHKNTAARKISRLHKRLKKIGE